MISRHAEYTVWMPGQKDKSHSRQNEAGWYEIYDATHTSEQFKAYKLDIPEIFHLILLDSY
jgi:hypothetical protein